MDYTALYPRGQNFITTAVRTSNPTYKKRMTDLGLLEEPGMQSA
jgi:hypothetical protein